MKTIIFFTLLFTSISSFSQELKKLDSDTIPIFKPAVKELSNDNLFSKKEIDEDLIYKSFNNCINIPELKAKNHLDFSKSIPKVENNRYLDNMPVLKPVSNHATPVIVPDTTINYTLLIKPVY